MTNQSTVDKLLEMRLTTMAESFQLQLQDPAYQELSFDERFALMVDEEWLRRKNNKQARLISHASFKFPSACAEDIDYFPDRKLDKPLITRLTACNYIVDNRNVIIMGASGSGKSYLACALGVAACRKFYTVRYIRLPDLLDELAMARGEGTFQKTIRQYKKVNLLILDEWLLTALGDTASRDLLEIIEARDEGCSTIFCSQFAKAGWHERIMEGTISDAILDRVIHNSYSLVIDGNLSMRERHALKD